MKLHARGTLLPYREVRRARVYSRYENSPRPASSSTGARRRRVAGEEALCGRTAWSAARSSSARPRPGPRCGKCTEPCPWGLEVSRCPLIRKPKGPPTLAACDTRQAQERAWALTATHQKVNRLTHHIHIPAKILVRPDPPKKQAGAPPPQAKCSPSTPGSSSSARILPETPQQKTPASSKTPRTRPPVRPPNQAKPRAVPVEGNDAPARDAHRPERAAGAPHREERAVRAVRAAVARRGAGTEAARDVRAAAPLLLCVAQV